MSLEKNAYIAMLKDILIQKEKIMQGILVLTQEQEKVLLGGMEDIERFEATLPKKQELIDTLERLDRGFSDAYAKVQTSLLGKKKDYRQEIQELQKQITAITDISVKLQALEEKNRKAFELYLTAKKQQFKEFKVSSRTASAYYKNMTGKPQGESYFMDKKK